MADPPQALRVVRRQPVDRIEHRLHFGGGGARPPARAVGRGLAAFDAATRRDRVVERREPAHQQSSLQGEQRHERERDPDQQPLAEAHDRGVEF